MHSSAALISLLVAAACAAPTTSTNGKAVTVILSDSGSDESDTTFQSVTSRKFKAPNGSHGPFDFISIDVGSQADQALRCQALDSNGTPIVGTRGANIDNSFSDADKGRWTFQKENQLVSEIVCDPAIAAITANNFEVNVTLTNTATEATSLSTVSNTFTHTQTQPQGSSGPFDQVQITVGSKVNPAFRCAVLNQSGKRIPLVRGTSHENTASDAGKGPWTFKNGAKDVLAIVCDPTFVATA